MKTRRPNPSSRAPRAAGPQPPIFHVSEGWSRKGWAVRRTGSTRPTRIYPTRQAAIKAACLIARLSHLVNQPTHAQPNWSALSSHLHPRDPSMARPDLRWLSASHIQARWQALLSHRMDRHEGGRCARLQRTQHQGSVRGTGCIIWRHALMGVPNGCLGASQAFDRTPSVRSPDPVKTLADALSHRDALVCHEINQRENALAECARLRAQIVDMRERQRRAAGMLVA